MAPFGTLNLLCRTNFIDLQNVRGNQARNEGRYGVLGSMEGQDPVSITARELPLFPGFLEEGSPLPHRGGESAMFLGPWAPL